MKNFWISRHNKKEAEKRRQMLEDLASAIKRKIFQKYLPRRKP